MEIAVIGTGISGLIIAWLLGRQHAVTVFEANDYLGGHSNTVPIEILGRRYDVDTGFIVFNRRTYPNFCRLLERLGVDSQESEMSFSVKSELSGLEYCGTSLNTIFAQRSNLFRWQFLRMLYDIQRFNRESQQLLAAGSEITLGDYLDRSNYSLAFRENYLIPMGAAIWSTSPDQMLDFPGRYFVRFLDNHGLLSLVDRPRWRTIVGGSKNYVSRLAQPDRDRIRLNCPVQSIRRTPEGVTVNSACGSERFDQVVLATHGDQALRLLADPTPREQEILSAFTCSKNVAILHTDAGLLPVRRRAWASWNYNIPKVPASSPSVTYQMNILQKLDCPEPICVTLNREDAIEPAKVIRKFHYEHPIYSVEAVAAQQRHREISGIALQTHYCGAYWGYGFHEDGVNSALAVARDFGVQGIE